MAPRTTARKRTRGQGRITRVDWLVQSIAEEIVDGRLDPGTRLDEQGLADRFDVSRTPVREAIGQLVAMGMLEKRPHAGAIVRTVTVDLLNQMFEVMAELEAACARLAAERMSADERKDLDALHAQTARAVENDDQAAYEALNRRFHSAIYGGTHNTLLVDTTREARRRVAPYRRAQFNVPGRMRSSYEEHGEVVAAIRAGDGERAYRAMRGHILTVRDASVFYVAETLNLEQARSGSR